MTQLTTPLVRAKFAWMFSSKIDLMFFFLPILIAPIIFILSQSSFVLKSVLWGALFLNAFGLGDFHVGVTWFNYFDSKNRNFYSSSFSNAVTYFVLPVVVIVLSMAGMFFCPSLIVLVFIVWSIQHLVQQNVGLLLLYHNYGTNEAIVSRDLEIKSLHVGAIFFSLLFAQRILFPALCLSLFWLAAVIVIGLMFFILIVTYLRELFAQVSAGASLNLSAIAFWCLSICFFVPFAFLGRSYSDAILISNIMHWAQYIGIMYVLVGRKYKQEQLNNLPIGRPMLLFMLVGIGVVFLIGINRLFPAVMLNNSSWLFKDMIGFLLGMSMVHYLQDAFMWRFREPYYKETVLAYLRSSA